MEGIKDFFGGLMSKVGGFFSDTFKDGVGPGLKKLAPWAGALLGSSLFGGVFDWIGKNLLGDFPGSGLIGKLLAGVAGYFLTDWIVGSVFDDKKPAGATAAAPTTAAAPAPAAPATTTAANTAENKPTTVATAAAPAPVVPAAGAPAPIADEQNARFAKILPIFAGSMTAGEGGLRARSTPATDSGFNGIALPAAA